MTICVLVEIGKRKRASSLLSMATSPGRAEKRGLQSPDSRQWKTQLQLHYDSDSCQDSAKNGVPFVARPLSIARSCLGRMGANVATRTAGTGKRDSS